MNPLHYIFLTILLALPLSGCRHRGDHWPQATPHADSIVRQLDRAFFLDSMVLAPPLVDSLAAEAARHPDNKPLQVLSLYWKALAYDAAMPDSAEKWIREACSLTEPRSNPYVTARLDLLDNPEITKENFLTRHKRLKEIVSYFQSVGDLPMQMMAARYLGTFYVHIGDMRKYRDNSFLVNELCKRMGNETLVTKSTLNLGLAEIHVGDSAKAREILIGLLASPLVKDDSLFKSRIYVNLGILEAEPSHFQKALDLNRHFRNSPDIVFTLQLAMMKKYEQRTMYPQADSLFRMIADAVLTDGDAEARRAIYAIMARHARERGDLEEYVACSDSVRTLETQNFSPRQYEELTKDSYSALLDRSEKETRDRDRMATLKIILIIILGGLVTLIIIFYFKSRTDRLRLRQAEDKARIAEMEKENLKDKNSLSAMALSMTERDRLIADLTASAERLRRAGEISESAEEALLRKIRLGQIDINEWDDFQAAHSKIHPLFLKRLKENYPDITEGDSRLALHIAAGFSNKQIARIMQLQPDSVKKNRQRLRRRMHIEADDALEHTLRELL